MVIGRDIFSELKIDLCFSNNIIMVDVGAYKGYTASMKEISKINCNFSPDFLKGEI